MVRVAKTDLLTTDAEKIYVYDYAGERFAIAGADEAPPGIDPSNLPEGFRRVSEEEWENAADAHAAHLDT